MLDKIHDIALFEHLTDDELEWLFANSTEVFVEPGEVFFREGVLDERFYIVLEGELQVTRMMDGVLRVLGTTPRGVIGGELGLLNGIPQPSTSKAIMPTRLLVLDKKAFRMIFSAVPPLGMRILRIAADRMSGVANRITQDEKLAALGKFSAGLAHELNNPASAARRAAQAFYDLLPNLQAKSMELCSLGLDTSQLDSLLEVQRGYARRAEEEYPQFSPIEQTDHEDELSDWLDEIGVSNGYNLAPDFVNSGVLRADVERLLHPYPQHAHVGIVEWFHAALYASTLLCEIDDSTTRISELVKAVKEYTYMDQGKLQTVDIHKSLETTLKVLGHKLKNVEVIREYDSTLPKILANGGELNQVWTNLLDNAIDALEGHQDARILLSTRCESDFVMVEITDNGSGIPKEIMKNIFEPFFTTKGVGQGTGLGLDIVYRIIHQHNGVVEVQSQPGNTRFIVRLPVSQPDSGTVVEE